jgi:ABC-type uncharacterized transport system involved in gliding motility auxiliary subunit
MKITKNMRLQLALQKYIFIILLLTVSGLLAWLSLQHSVQFDWTANKRNSLSQGSIELLHTLKEPVVVNVYLQDEPTVKKAVEEILNRYQREKADFKYKLINPDIDIELAQQDNIRQYGQVIIKYKDRRESISSLSEQSISSALQRLSRSGDRTLVFVKGHGERDPSDTENIGYSQLAARLSTKGIKTVMINLLETPIPEETTALVIAAPNNPFLRGELEHIKNFINDGGNLLWLMDPGKMQGLETLANELGIAFLNGIVVDNNTNLRQTLRIQHPAMIPVLDYHPHAITKTISYNTLFPISRGLKTSSLSQWDSTVIAQSLEQSWLETQELGEEIAFDSESGDIAGPVPIVMALERIITSESAAPVKASQRVVVSGDSEFLANGYIGMGANLTLGENIANWLVGDDDLIAIEIKNAPDTQLQLDDIEILFIGVGFFLLLPAGLVATGFLIWFKRRKR